MDKLNSIYTDPGNPGGYSGVVSLYKEAKKKFPEITKKEVDRFLEGNRTYTLFKPRRVNFKRSRFIPTGFLSDLHVDLGDFQKLSSKNKGYRYLLVGVDVLSKRMFTSPVKTKKPADMIIAFDELFKQMPHLPSRIFSDRGLEFEAKDMRQYFKDKFIMKHKSTNSDVKAALAERGIRTIKQRLYRYFSEKNTVNWYS